MPYQTIAVERRAPVAFIRLNRPEKLNALNRQMKDEIIAALDELRTEPTVQVVIVRGEGAKAFCAGADVNEFKARGPVERWRYDRDYPRNLFDEIERFPKPVIAMIHGYCLGGGAEIALACDLRVAADDVQIGLTELRFGMIPGAGGTQRLARLVGEGKAMQLVLSADPISASEAHRIGLVEEIVPAAELESFTMALAGRIGRHSPIAIQVGKEAVRSAARMTLEGGLRYEVALSTLCFGTEDKEEAVNAFFERREPHFQGR